MEGSVTLRCAGPSIPFRQNAAFASNFSFRMQASNLACMDRVKTQHRRLTQGWAGCLVVLSLLAWTEWKAVLDGRLIHATAYFVWAWLASLVLFVVMRQRVMAALALSFSAAFLWTWSEPWRQTPHTLSADQSSVRLRALWINAWRKPDCILEVIRHADENDIDILMMTEVESQASRDCLDEAFAYSTYHEDDLMGVWSHLPLHELKWNVIESEADPKPKVLLTGLVEIPNPDGEDVRFPILVAHVKRPRFEAHAQGMAALNDFTRPAGPQLLVGDFNCTPWASSFHKLLDNGWHDARAGKFPSRTWRKPSFPLMRWPIDHVLVRGACSVSRFEIGSSLGSDHLPLSFDVQVAVP